MSRTLKKIMILEMKDSDIKKIFKIPNTTFYEWKKRNDYRKNLIEFLQAISFDEAIEILKRTPKKNINIIPDNSEE